MERERPEQRVAEVDQVHALIDELAAARNGAACTPFATRSQGGRRGRSAHARGAPGRTSRLAPGRSPRAIAGWKRWLKPTFTLRRQPRPLRNPPDVRDPDPRRLLDKDVRRGVERPTCVLGQPVVGERDDDDVEVVPSSSSNDSHARPPNEATSDRVAPSSTSKQATSMSSPSAPPLVADQPAADDADAKRGTLRPAGVTCTRRRSSPGTRSRTGAPAHVRRPWPGACRRAAGRRRAGTPAPRADDLPADDPAPARERVEVVDPLRRHAGRPAHLVLPVLVHELAELLDLAALEQGPTLKPSSFVRSRLARISSSPSSVR